jgi:hypothetical protein
LAAAAGSPANNKQSFQPQPSATVQRINEIRAMPDHAKNIALVAELEQLALKAFLEKMRESNAGGGGDGGGGSGSGSRSVPSLFSPSLPKTLISPEASRALLEAFRDSSDAELVFPPGQSSHERQIVHTIAAELGLRSQSMGEGDNRRLTVSRKPRSPFANPQRGPFFALYQRSDHSLVPFIRCASSRTKGNDDRGDDFGGDGDAYEEDDRCGEDDANGLGNPEGEGLAGAGVLKCPKGHEMAQSAYAGGAYASGWSCDRCRVSGQGKRWWCHKCGCDYCLRCSAF